MQIRNALNVILLIIHFLIFATLKINFEVNVTLLKLYFFCSLHRQIIRVTLH